MVRSNSSARPDPVPSPLRAPTPIVPPNSRASSTWIDDLSRGEQKSFPAEAAPVIRILAPTPESNLPGPPVLHPGPARSAAWTDELVKKTINMESAFDESSSSESSEAGSRTSLDSEPLDPASPQQAEPATTSPAQTAATTPASGAESRPGPPHARPSLEEGGQGPRGAALAATPVHPGALKVGTGAPGIGPPSGGSTRDAVFGVEEGPQGGYWHPHDGADNQRPRVD